jgi:hypothetical protein
MGTQGGGPPDKFPQWVDLSTYPMPSDKAVALGIAYAKFYQTFGVWPTVAITVGEVVYLGAYGR